MTRTVTDGVISEALVAARRHDGAITVRELAWALQCSDGRARGIIAAAVDRGRMVPLGESQTGACCYGPKP